MKKISFLLLVTLTALISSCEKDLKINAPYKEIAVVYALLNPNDGTQYIRINKAFLGEGNANVMAKVPDSTNYKEGQLDVKLECYYRGQKTKTITLQDTVTYIKDAGAFSNKQLLYKTSEKILQNGSIYKLVITNKTTGNLVTSETSILNAFTGFYGANVFYNGDYTEFSSQWNVTNPSDKEFDAKAQVIVLFHYTEVTATDSTEKTVQWILPTVSATDSRVASTGSVPLPGEQFYQTVSSSIPYDSKVIYRKIGKLDYTLTVIPDSLNNYIIINQPSTGIVQDKNPYTNITNGIGFFCSRVIVKQLNQTMEIKSREWLASPANPYTKALHFVQ